MEEQVNKLINDVAAIAADLHSLTSTVNEIRGKVESSVSDRCTLHSGQVAKDAELDNKIGSSLHTIIWLIGILIVLEVGVNGYQLTTTNINSSTINQIEIRQQAVMKWISETDPKIDRIDRDIATFKALEEERHKNKQNKPW